MTKRDAGNVAGLPRIGIGSFCYKYNMGFDGFRPPNPMNALAFLNEAKRLGFQGVQLCENFGYAGFSDSELLAIKDRAGELGLSIDIGMNDLSAANIERHLEIIELMSSKFLRIVLGGGTHTGPEMEVFRNKAAEIIGKVLPRLRTLDVTVGIENHFDLPSDYLVRLVKDINDKRVGLIFDTTNCLGFMEKPEYVLDIFKPYLLSLHLKDYIVYKVAGGYRISGVPLGEGIQDMKTLVKTAVAYNPDLTIILEMPIHDKPGQSAEDIIAWERTAVEKSARYLKEHLSELTGR